MIYLICSHDSKQRIAQVDTTDDLKSKYWKQILDLTSHKNVLYSLETFELLDRKPLPNRVNIVYSNVSKKKLPIVVNAILINNLKEIFESYANAQDDIYVIATTREIIEAFAKQADYLIAYQTEEIGYIKQSLLDSINLADYDQLKEEKLDKYIIRYFVRQQNNYIGR